MQSSQHKQVLHYIRDALAKNRNGDGVETLIPQLEQWLTDLYVDRNSAVYKGTNIDGKPIKTHQKKTATRTRGVQGASDEIKKKPIKAAGKTRGRA